MTKNILVHLGGVDCTAYLRRAIKTETYGDSISIYDLEFIKTVNDAVEITNALDVEIWLDANDPPTTKIFNGFIDNFNPEGGLIKITAKDDLAQLINRQVTKFYDSTVPGDPSNPDGKISDIFNDLVTTYGGLSTNTGATVQDSGTDIVLTKFACNSADIFERCRKLAEALSWVFYYRADTGFVYFEPKNYTTNLNTLEVGVNVLEIPTWEYDRSEMINDLTVNGAQQLVSSSEVFTGNASETTFTLTNTPVSATVYYSAAKNYATTAKLQQEVKIVDLPGTLNTHDVELDRKNSTITFTSFVPAASANNILVEYTYFVPIPVHLDNPVSITTYGYYSKTLDFTDVLTFNDAWKRGQNIIDKYAQPFKSTKLKTKWTSTLDVRVGQAISVIDEVNSPNVNQVFTIYRTRDYWPEAFTEIEVGNKQHTIAEYHANVVERLKRLEETIIGTGNVAPTEIKQNNIQFGFEPDTTTIQVDLVNDSFILNHPINGVLYAEDETAIINDFESIWTNGDADAWYTFDDTLNDFAGTRNGTVQILATAYYPFNGNANDESTSGNNGTVSAAILTTDRFNVGGKAYYFNGASYIAIGDIIPNTLVTFSAWIQSTDTSARIMGGKGASGESVATNTQYFATAGDNTLRYVTETGAGGTNHEYNITTTTNAVDGNWHHVVFVVNTTTLTVYVDGVLEGTETVVNTDSTCTTCFIGSYYTGTTAAWVGKIDEVVILPVALTTNEVAALYELQSRHDWNDVYITGEYDKAAELLMIGNSTDRPIYGSSIYLSSYVSFPPTSGSISWWQKFNTLAAGIDNYTRIFSYGQNNSSARIDANLTLNAVVFESYTNNAFQFVATTGIDMDDGLFHHYVITLGTTSSKLYVDGVLAYTTTANTDVVNQRYMWIGAYGAATYGSGLQGAIDEVRFYSKELSQSEVTSIYSNSPIQMTLTQNSTTGEYVVGSYGTKINFTNAGTGILKKVL